jgi:hypothetical protein
LFTTVNIQNVLYLDELYSWAESTGLRVVLNVLKGPQFMNIDYMTQAAKDLVIEKFQNSSIPELQSIANRVKKSPGSNGEKFIEYMQQLDKWRNENFGLTHKEIANAMGYML